MPMASRIVASSSLCVTITMGMAAAIKRVFRRNPRPRAAGTRPSRRPAPYGRRRPRADPVRDLARRLRTLAPTHGLDLHSSLRTAALRWLVHCRWRGYSKRKIARTMLIATKLDLYGRAAPVPERYFDAARDLDVRPDNDGPEFFLAASARDRVAAWLPPPAPPAPPPPPLPPPAA